MVEFTLRQAADRLALSPETLRGQVRKGKIKARKFGHVWVVSEREVERYRANHLRSASGS